jgi:hypothetical protein
MNIFPKYFGSEHSLNNFGSQLLFVKLIFFFNKSKKNTLARSCHVHDIGLYLLDLLWAWPIIRLINQ